MAESSVLKSTADRPWRLGLKWVAVVAGICAAWIGRDVLLLAFFSVLLALVFSFPVGLLERLMPRGLAVLVLLVVLFGAVAGAVLFAAPVISAQASELAQKVPQAVQELRERVEDGQIPVRQAARSAEQGAGQVIKSAVGKVLPAVFGVASGVVVAVLVVFLAAFFVYRPDNYRRAVRALVPREHEPIFDEAWRRMGHQLRGWVAGIFVSMAIMGALTALGLGLAGIHGWLLLGLLTFVATFVPYLGAFASAAPGILVALTQSPRHALLAALVYLGVHIVEGYLVSPLVMRRAVEVRPAVLLINQAFLGAVLGILGVVVATPLLVAARTLLGYLYVERKLGKPAAELESS